MAALIVIATFAPASVFAEGSSAADLYRRGREALTRGDADQAVELLGKAAALEPGNAEYQFRTAKAEMAAGAAAGMFGALPHARNARAALERAIAADPDRLNARLAMLEFCLMAPAFLGGGPAAADAQREEVRKRDAIEGAWAQSRIDVVAKKLDAAKAVLAAAVQSHPTSCRAHYRFGLFLADGETNYPAALQSLQRAMQLEPGFLPAYFEFGRVAAIAGLNRAAGVSALKAYLRATPGDDDPPPARAHFWLGKLYQQGGDAPAAQAEYALSLRLNPTQKDARAALAARP